jgi:hypothetical protein
MVSRRNSPETAEEYLRIIVQEGFAPAFAEQGYRLPAKIDIDFGFTSHGSRKGPVGEYYEGAATTNGVPKMNIRCSTADIDRIFEAVGHQVLHAAVGAEHGHGKPFRDCALRMQYVGSKMKEAVPGPKLMERVHALAESLGPFPRGALKFETHDPAGVEKPPKLSADSPERQENRHLKCECLINDCGYIARVSAKTLREKGPPICPVHLRPMWNEALPPDPRAARETQREPAVEQRSLEIEHQPVPLIEFRPSLPGEAA